MAGQINNRKPDGSSSGLFLDGATSDGADLTRSSRQLLQITDDETCGLVDEHCNGFIRQHVGTV
jgi:hypothetical protein